jgi:hypothetical protein
MITVTIARDRAFHISDRSRDLKQVSDHRKSVSKLILVVMPIAVVCSKEWAWDEFKGGNIHWAP